MKTIEEIRAEIKAKFDACEKIMADAEGKPLSEEKETEYNAAEEEINKLTAQLNRMVSHEALKAHLTGPTTPPITPAQPGVPATAGLEVNTPADPKCGFAHAGEFAQCVHRAQIGLKQGRDLFDPRMKAMFEEFGEDAGVLDMKADAPTNTHVESGEDEGMMVPPDFRNEMWELMTDGDSILAAMNPEETRSNTVMIIRDQSTPWDAAGIQTKWEGEAQQLTASKLATQGDQVRLHKHFAFVNASEEILQDAPLLNNRLMRKAPEAIRWHVSEALVNGTGVGQPLGWAQSDARVVVDKETSQTLETINAQNVSKMFSRMWPAGHADAFWMIGPDSLPQLFTMVLGDKPIWIPPEKSFQDAPGGFLFGRPVKINQHADTVGTEGDIQYVSPQGYYSAVKAGGIQMARSIHLFFDFDVVAFRWTIRIGGQPFASTPISQDKSALDLSHFVFLQTRA